MYCLIVRGRAALHSMTNVYEFTLLLYSNYNNAIMTIKYCSKITSKKNKNTGTFYCTDSRGYVLIRFEVSCVTIPWILVAEHCTKTSFTNQSFECILKVYFRFGWFGGTDQEKYFSRFANWLRQIDIGKI